MYRIRGQDRHSIVSTMRKREERNQNFLELEEFEARSFVSLIFWICLKLESELLAPSIRHRPDQKVCARACVEKSINELVMESVSQTSDS
jgi:hypothetical protein